MHTSASTAARAGKVLSTATRVRAGMDGQLVAECRPCRLHFEQLPGTDVGRALSAFDEAHAPGDAPHDRSLPWGWRAARAPLAS